MEIKTKNTITQSTGRTRNKSNTSNGLLASTQISEVGPLFPSLTHGLRLQPFRINHGMCSSFYEFQVVSKSDKKEIVDKKRRTVTLEFNPDDTIKTMNCDCEGFNITNQCEKPCQCIKDCIKTLKEWGEIQ